MIRNDLRQAVGHLIICGFEGQAQGAELKEILSEVRPLGLIAFARNIASAAQYGDLNVELKRYRTGEPLLLCLDHEGGRVARLHQGITMWPPMRQLGDTRDDALAQAVGGAMARELRALHVDVNFAPVLDVDTNADNPVIGDRSFSRDPGEVGRFGAALVRGLQGAGVGACGKHFPGHGDTAVDSHLALPTVPHALERLQRVEWPPFAAAIAAGVGAVMTAHVVVEAMGPEPATLSRVLLTEHLRGTLGFEGVIISDDIDMQAVAGHYGAATIGERGLLAGCDIFLACRKPEAILALYGGLVRAVERGIISHQALHDASQRAQAWRRRFYRPPSSDPRLLRWLNCAAHLALAAKISDRAAKNRS